MSQTEKHTFWTKVKTSTKSITTSIGGLSLRSEHDGDSPESTLIHKALVNYYTQEGRGYPEWLGQVEQKQQMRLTPQNNCIPQAHAAQSSQRSDQYKPEMNKYRRQHSFKDMYQNPQSTPAAQTQTQQPSPSKNRMKDRLKRHNYRNEFSVE